MGLYNYDALLSEEDAIPLEAIVEIKGMPDLQVDDLYVVYDSLNTSYLYSKYFALINLNFSNSGSQDSRISSSFFLSLS